MAKKTKQNGVRTFQESVAEWRSIADKVRKRAVAVDDSTHDRGWAMAATVGIPRCGCSLHNASIDDAMTGWCKGTPERLRVAKRANQAMHPFYVVRAMGGILFLLGALVMVYNLVRTARGDLRAEKPYAAPVAAPAE
jgi:hypothetical protein